VRSKRTYAAKKTLNSGRDPKKAVLAGRGRSWPGGRSRKWKRMEVLCGLRKIKLLGPVYETRTLKKKRSEVV
jgi:hypothetical protein